MMHLPEIANGDGVMGEIPPGAVADGEVLRRLRVTILQSAVGQTPQIDLPAASDGGQGIGRGPSRFVQAVERKRTIISRDDVGQFLDNEVIRLLLEFHADIVGADRTFECLSGLVIVLTWAV